MTTARTAESPTRLGASHASVRQTDLRSPQGAAVVPVASLLLVLVLSMLVIRVAAVALRMTGLSDEVARFQALSAFSGTGFTTDEAEAVVTSPPRRRVAAVLIRLGSVGVVTSIAALLLSFVGAGQAAPARLLTLVAGVLALVALARSRAFDRLLTRVIERALARYTALDLRDYADLLHLHEDYRIVEIKVSPDSWLSDRALGELALAGEGVVVLGVKRSDGSYVGAPPEGLRLHPGDLLLVYGRERRLQELSARVTGDQAAHREARAEHARDLDRQRERLERADAV